MKEDWKEYIAFSRKERNGVIVLLVLVILLSVLPYFYPEPDDVPDPAETREWQSKLAAWKGKKKVNEKDMARKEETFDPGGKVPGSSLSSVPAPESSPSILFPFDPNLISADDWKKLGVPDKVIRTIFNYLRKGGQFRRPEDIARIYGMREQDVKRLLPYARIHAQSKPAFGSARTVAEPRFGDTVKNTLAGHFPNLTSPPIRKKRYASIDINSADTSAWMGFPGIGSRLAFRIVQFREKLGGFYSADQVGETYALPDSTFQKIRPWLNCQSPVFRKIRINIAELEELRQHPYLRWNTANAIVQYRKQHGPFGSAKDLQKIVLMDPLLITKIAPYLEY